MRRGICKRRSLLKKSGNLESAQPPGKSPRRPHLPGAVASELAGRRRKNKVRPNAPKKPGLLVVRKRNSEQVEQLHIVQGGGGRCSLSVARHGDDLDRRSKQLIDWH